MRDQPAELEKLISEVEGSVALPLVQARIDVLSNEYQALGSSIKSYMQLTTQIVTLATVVVSAGAAVGLSVHSDQLLMLLPLGWGVIGLYAGRIYREVLAMGAMRRWLEEQMSAVFLVPTLVWEATVVKDVLHARLYSWAENGTVLGVLLVAVTGGVNAATNSHFHGKLSLLAFVLYLSATSMMLVLLSASIYRTIGCAGRSYDAIKIGAGSKLAPTAREGASPEDLEQA